MEMSWAKAAALGAETVGVLLFKNIFAIAPGALARLMKMRTAHTFVKNAKTGDKYKAAGLTPLHVLCGARLQDLRALRLLGAAVGHLRLGGTATRARRSRLGCRHRRHDRGCR